MSKQNKLVNFECPPTLLKEFDYAILGYYGGRSEALRALMRQFIKELKKERS